MKRATRSPVLVGLAFTAFCMTRAATPDCSSWTLDGYRLGMRGDEVLTVHSVTLHVEGQAQAIESGKFSGVLVLDPLDRLEKWEVVYDSGDGEGLRAELRRRFGAPTSDVTGNVPGDEPDNVRQRRTIWWSTGCDAALIVYENTSLRGTPVHSVHATLARTSMLPKGLAEMKTLFH